MKKVLAYVTIFVVALFGLTFIPLLPTSTLALAKPCNMATFVKDITFADNGIGKGPSVKPGTKFRKTWQIKNVGTCTWTPEYKWAFDHGFLLNGKSTQPLSNTPVMPGQTLNVSVDLTAPMEEGVYTGYWRLVDPQGQDFGTTLGRSFYVTITVSSAYSTGNTSSKPNNQTNRVIYYPFRDCAPSRLFVGDHVYVSYGGGPNGIRSAPDVHPNNIFYRAQEGEGMRILSGPKCSWGWLIWEVQTDSGPRGWTPESDGEEFWLIPMDEPPALPSALKNNRTAYEAYQKANSIMQDTSLTDDQKRSKLRIVQNTYGEEIFTTVIRYVPIYDSETGQVMSFDSYMRLFASESGRSTSSAPIEQDPVGAGLSIFFNPSSENIQKMLGIP